MFPEFTRFFDAHCWAKGPSQLTQKSLCHCSGVKPGLAGVTIMSAKDFTPTWGGSVNHARKPRRQAPYARSGPLRPRSAAAWNVAKRGDYACKSRELCAMRRDPDRCQAATGSLANHCRKGQING